MIDNFRDPQRGLLVLDGGDAILNVPRPAGPIQAPEQAKALSMLRGLGSIGVDALAIGEAELAFERPQLLEQARHAGVPLLGANLQDKRGRSPFLPRRLLQTGGVKVGVFAVYQEAKGGNAAETAGLRAQDAVKSAQAQVAALRKEGAELLVMLAHLGMPRAREVAAAVPGIHLGLVAHTGWRTNEPEVVGGKTFLVEAGRRGQIVAHLEVRLGEGWQPDSSLVDDSRRHVLYMEAARELREVRQGLAAAVTQEIWQNRLQPQAARAQLLAKQLSQVRPPAASHSLVVRLIELDETVPEQAAMKALLSSRR